MLHLLFQLFTGYIERDDYIKLVVAQEIKTLKTIVSRKKPTFLYDFYLHSRLLSLVYLPFFESFRLCTTIHTAEVSDVDVTFLAEKKNKIYKYFLIFFVKFTT